MQLTLKNAGFEVDSEPIIICSMSSPGGLEVETTNLGAAVLSIRLPDQPAGTDVLLGFETLSKQLEKGPMFGTTLGRCAGKIPHGIYQHKGKEICLSLSHGQHHGHGGCRGFDKRAFTVHHTEEDAITYRYISPDGEEGYPGTLCLDVTYRLSHDTLTVEYQAISDADTLVNISNHMYFNLFGADQGNAGAHEVAVRASNIVGLNAEGLPDGSIVSIYGSAMDLQEPVVLDHQLSKQDEKRFPFNSFDHDYLLNPGTDAVAVVCAPETGRSMRLYTDSPCIHVYLCDLGQMRYPGKNDAVYTGRCGLCLEPMYAGNSVNNHIGPSPILAANTLWKRKTMLQFNWNAENQINAEKRNVR